MRDVKKSEIVKEFGKKTYDRGESYFLDGHVEIGTKKGDILYGTVRGRERSPYRTWVEIIEGIEEITSGCSCPVGYMCKHGVALLLQWVEDRTAFIDIDHLLGSLQKKSKDDLITMIELLLENDPLLAMKIAFTGQLEGRMTGTDISKRFDHLKKHYDYHSLSEFITEFEHLKSVGNRYASENNVEGAMEIYLSLIENGLDLFAYGIDDSGGNWGDVIISCVEDAGKIGGELPESQQSKIIPEIMKMIENDQYGLEIEMLLCDMATKENFSMIEKAVVERILSLSGESNTFQRECMLDLLVDLYEKCENPSAVVDTLISLGLRDEQDYRRIADVLSSEGDNRKAFSYVREGLSAGGSESSELHKLYFTLLPHVLDEEDVEVEEALAVALELISDKIFNPQEYMDIKGVFEEWGRYEVLISGIKEKCDDNRVVDVLLFEDRIDELIDLVSSSDSIEPKKLMKIAYAVKEEGNHECSLNLVHRALKSQFLFPYPLAEKMISFFVKEADIGMIEDVMNEIPFAVENCFATALLSRNQEYAMKMLRNLVYTSDREEVRGYIALLETQYAVELGQLWIEHVVSRSRYDDAVEMLGLLKDKMEKKEWESYISTFKETHSRKRTLLAKMEEL